MLLTGKALAARVIPGRASEDALQRAERCLLAPYAGAAVTIVAITTVMLYMDLRE